MKTIIVTGATNGIGYELAVSLAKEGYRVLATGRDMDKLQELRELTGCEIIRADLSKSNEAQSLFKESVSIFGDIDVLINNAGMNTRKCGIDEFEIEEFDYQYAVNLRAPAILSREALKHMKPNGAGQIINVISTAAKRTSTDISIYSTMKSGLATFSTILMKEAQPFGIKVTGVFPGGTDSNFREAERPHYMRSESVSETIKTILTLPDDVFMHEITFRPQSDLE
ncbi:SDR family oxidoreductase [Vibrio sp. WXL103]|uniref:SDR family oxidoreductase n=1 Tax=Vibrio sp. WXL103 TaxID=3450710 RepID=UPI003EC6702B